MHFTITICIISLLVLYGVFACIAAYGWLREQQLPDTRHASLPGCSIIIAARNEEANLDRLFRSIVSQNTFPAEWELILVDDHSDDKTAEMAERYSCQYPAIRLLRLCGAGSGKKAAIALGLSQARYSVILQTDADCVFHADWLAAMLRPFASGADIAIGPVCYVRGNGWLNRIFRLEFLSMSAAGAGLAMAGKPVFCNAANMAYRADIARGLSVNTKPVSGDDVFLLHAFKQSARTIRYVRDRNAIVHTDAPQSIRAFMNQRIRWGSKAKYYTDRDTVLLSLLVAMVNIALAAGLAVAVLFGGWDWYLVLFAGKVLFDMLLFSVSLPFFSQGSLLIFVPILSIIYPFYIAFASIYSIFAQYEWKGRRHF